MRYIFLDRSFTTNTCQKGKETQWDAAINSLNKIIPGFENTPFNKCITPLWFLEHIGLGKFREQNKKSLHVNITYNEFINKHEKLEDAALSMIHHVRKHLESFFRKTLTVKYLTHNAIKSLHNHPFHTSAISLKTEIKKWRNNLKTNKTLYDRIIFDLTIDTLLRYQYINPSNLSKEERIRAADFYSHIYHSLAKTLITSRKNKCNITGFSLFHEVKNFWDALLNRTLSRSHLLRPWDDMVDPELIHYAQLGYYEDDTLHPVIVITSENQTRNFKKIQIHKETISHFETLGYPFETRPGIIINFAPEHNYEPTTYDFNI